MAEKLDVIITERPGLYSIENFESLKETLQEYTRQYVGAQFDCDDKESRKMAKDICADLRKMKGTIEDRRKDIKKRCLEPYNVLEQKCKELTTMIDKFAGRPVGLSNLAAAIGEDAGTLEDVYEPYLIKNGFLMRTPTGRVVTDLAYQHLGIIKPSQED